MSLLTENAEAINFPPQNFAQLRQLVIMIKQGEIALSIGKKSFTALALMVKTPELVVLNNIVELSAQIKLSPASITRLAKLLGFQGFNQFQLIFKQKSKTADHFYSQSVAQLMAENSQNNQKSENKKNIFKQHLADSLKNIELSIENITESDLDKAKKLLAKKHRIFIFGYRQSSAIASILRYGLALIRPNVQMLVQADHGVAIALGQLKKDDLLVVIGSAPYSELTIKIASLAQQQQCQILSITDTASSPLTDIAELALHIPTSGGFYANSMVANCFFVESLLSLTALELGATAIHNLQQHEQLLVDLEVTG
jgi:DNA-binding MurR/RpiR family transcriptional regulator